METYFINNQLNDGLKPEAVRELFNFLDTNKNGNISVDEFCLMIRGAGQSLEDRMNSAFSKELEAEFRDEISKLFDRLDTDKNRALSADEMVQMFRPSAN